jgi:biotin transport system ATP-binding protein
MNDFIEKKVLFSVQGLRKQFPNGHEGARGIDLDIYEGEILLIAGSNGSGKTLFMRMLSGLTEPSGGTILFQGKPLAQWGEALRRSIGLVFQDADAQLIGETVEEDIRFGPENLKLGKAETGERVAEVMERLSLHEKKDFSPRSLSGGEKRRLAIAGVLAMGCETLIMDEPFANLDWPGVVQVLKIIKELKSRGNTLIILTHELEKVLALADRLAILDQGRIRDAGNPEDVLNRLQETWGVRDPRHSYKNAADCTWL